MRINECANEVVKFLASRWGVNVLPPIPEVTALIQKAVDARLAEYRAEFVPDIPQTQPKPKKGKADSDGV